MRLREQNHRVQMQLVAQDSEHTLLRLHQKGDVCGWTSRENPRHDRNTGTSKLDDDAQPLSESEQHTMEALRRSWYLSVRGMARKFRVVLSRHGTTNYTEALHRQNRCGRKLLSGQLSLGNPYGTDAEYPPCKGTSNGAWDQLIAPRRLEM